MTAGRDFPRLEAHMRSSLLFRACEGVAAVGRTAAMNSATAAAIHDTRARFNALERHDRIRAIAIATAVGAAGHLLLARLMPSNLAPALPRSFWLLISATAIVAVVFARQLAAALQTSAIRRVIRHALKGVPYIP